MASNNKNTHTAGTILLSSANKTGQQKITEKTSARLRKIKIDADSLNEVITLTYKNDDTILLYF